MADQEIKEEGGRNVKKALPEEVDVIIKYDLTSTHAKYMDRHMLIHMLDHILKKGVYPVEQINDAELSVLSKTRMVDHYKSQYQEYKGVEDKDLPAHFDEQRESLILEIQQLEARCKPFLDKFFPGGDITKAWENYYEMVAEAKMAEENSKNPGPTAFSLSVLREEGIPKEQLESVYELAKVKYETGDYEAASFLLQVYRRVGDLDSDAEAKWGKYASEILIQWWPDALESLKLLQESIDSTNMSTITYQTEGAQLQARAWLMHWSLFVYFFYRDDKGIAVDDGFDKLVEMWLPDMFKLQMNAEREAKFPQWRYLRVIQTICPHLLRYIAAAVIIGSEESGKRASGMESGHIRMKQKFKELTQLIKNERRYYKDPITEFIHTLMSENDFEDAHKHLNDCELVMDSDFFLFDHKARFIRQARKMIFENHCRIHSVMDIGMVAKKLNTDTAEAERYIVKMIRGAQLDARIDSEANQVLLASSGNSIYRTVREKTNLIRHKTEQLIERLSDRRVWQNEESKEERPAQSTGHNQFPSSNQKSGAASGNMRDFVR